MRKLYWFQNDLRVQDNPGLLAQQDAERLLLVYLFPVNRPWCNVTGMGAQRERFLRESLQSLQRELGALGIQVYTHINGAPLDQPGFLELFELAAELGCAVWLHPLRASTVRLVASQDASDFLTVPICVESNDGPNTSATDAAPIGVGVVRYYLIRAENSCPSGPGPLGTDSSGSPRSAAGCS